MEGSKRKNGCAGVGARGRGRRDGRIIWRGKGAERKNKERK